MTHREHQTWHLTNDLDCVLQEVLLGRPSHKHLSSALTLKQGAHPATSVTSCNTTGTIIRLPEQAHHCYSAKADTLTALAERLRPMHNRAHRTGSNLSRKEVTSAMHQGHRYTVRKKLCDLRHLTAKTAAQLQPSFSFSCCCRVF